jgi:uncharacterized membrane protein YfcA
MTSAFTLIVAAIAFFAGSVGSVAGFGIGSILTPLVATQLGTKFAVAAVTIPHIAGSTVRFWTLRQHVHRRVLFTFGVMSMIGGLLGAFAHAYWTSHLLTIVLAIVLMITGAARLFGFHYHFRGAAAQAGGVISGFLGGLVGNQGPVRSAAMLGFELTKEQFVATSVAIGMVVDIARLPVYFWSQGHAIVKQWPIVAMMVGCVVAGTLLGRFVLGRVPEDHFKKMIAALIFALGVTLLVFA